ncbi:MAG: thioredoxin domain-containing protein [Rhodospirillales bacterium]|nr:thioredoxin domain-containing protein [Rhodospirillales bacterium]
MPLLRRSLLAAAAVTPAAILFAPEFARAAADPAFGLRTLGNPKAKVHVIEYFSLTCTHCAHFANHTMPEVRKKLIAPGSVYWIFRDFPLDRVALTAAMVARSLPLPRYAPFIFSLFASQDRWAFAPNVNSTAEIGKLAALDGMSQAAFQAAINNKALENFILEEQRHAEQKYRVDSTPTFIINGHPHPGDMPYVEFAKLIAAAGG